MLGAKMSSQSKSLPTAPRPKPRQMLEVEHFAQIDKAHIAFGDLTVLVGPQATGKSLILQWLKFALDPGETLSALKESGGNVKDPHALVDLLFGEGMASAWRPESRVALNGKTISPETMAKRTPPKREAKVFFIPAHRALLLVEGWPAPFLKLGADVPVVARLFSQNLYQRFSGRKAEPLFPVERLLKGDYRDLIDNAVFHGGRIDLHQQGLNYRLRLSFADQGIALPYMTWTAGQREFTPLLLGLYHVLIPRKQSKHPNVDWVVVEEPEMGLHPRAIAVFMLLVLDLLWRGYRVVLSTHSPLVLDVVWAIRQLQQFKARPQLLSEAFGIRDFRAVENVMTNALRAEYRSHFLSPDPSGRVQSRDISGLDPSSENSDESDWGGLTGFSARFGEAVRAAANESEFPTETPRLQGLDVPE
jgi:hypothetical protein